MLVARYWASARAEGKRPNGRDTGLQRYGWSNESQEAAEAHARQRAEQDLARRLAGETVAHRERSLPYNGVEGQPIREEILEEHACGVLTRNCYGAVCLNTEDALFVDVDWRQRSGLIGCLLIGLAVIGVIAGLAIRGTEGLVVGSALVSCALIFWVMEWMRTGESRGEGSPDWPPLRALRRWCEEHPDWLVRVYRTPMGLRLLVMHEAMGARSKKAMSFMRAMNADRRYVTMCKLQSCSRARVTPKSWRIEGGPERLTPRSGRWPIEDPEVLERRAAWVTAYDAARQGWSACRYVETIGSGSVDGGAEQVRDLHDRWSGALEGLPIA